ncbi:MAG: bifunctional riboflavin kinase/FAD synthetase [Bacteroidetes bacterium]|nr:bifunctional riboflavin kinase/FAD synthetase [Bacteroidota bacterium]
MEVIRDISDFRFDKNSAVTVGTFDGVHLGHRRIIDKLNGVRSSKNLRSIIITFEPHPQIVLKNRGKDIKILSTLEEKLSIFRECNVDITYVINFTREFSQTSASEFYINYLIKKIGLCDLILGYDHMFGKNREGNFDTLRELSHKYEFSIDKVEEYKPEGEHVSSSAVRHLLEKGEVAKAAGLLGRDYSLSGTVTKGRQLGRELGYPTANIKPDNEFKLIPGKGVYAVTSRIKGNEYSGMMSIGQNPTVTDDESIKLEVNLFDFSGDIYGEKITVNFMEYLRSEVKFDSIEELKDQMSRDKLSSGEIFAKLKSI